MWVIQLWWILEKLCKSHCCLCSLPLVFLFIVLPCLWVYFKMSSVGKTINSHLKGVCQILKHLFKSLTYFVLHILLIVFIETVCDTGLLFSITARMGLRASTPQLGLTPGCSEVMTIVIILCKVIEIMDLQIFNAFWLPLELWW